MVNYFVFLLLSSGIETHKIQIYKDVNDMSIAGSFLYLEYFIVS